MKAVTKYETSDGKLFDTEAEATRHEELLDEAQWYRDNALYGSDGDRVFWEDLREWLEDHP